MFKQIIFIIIVSAIAAFFTAHAYSILHALGSAQNFLIQTVIKWLPKAKLSTLISKVIVLVLVPIILGFLAAFVYWLIKHEEMPQLKPVVWTLWVISLLIFVLYKKV